MMKAFFFTRPCLTSTALTGISRSRNQRADADNPIRAGYLANPTACLTDRLPNGEERGHQRDRECSDHLPLLLGTLGRA